MISDIFLDTCAASTLNLAWIAKVSFTRSSSGSPFVVTVALLSVAQMYEERLPL